MTFLFMYLVLGLIEIVRKWAFR